MGFRTLRQCVETLRGEGEVIEIDHPIDPHLEIAEIQRRLFQGWRSGSSLHICSGYPASNTY